jgi:hypothetical protein
MVDWTLHEIGRDLLRLIPLCVIFVVGAAYTLAIVRCTASMTRRKLDANLVDRANGKAREAIRWRDQELSYLRRELERQKDLTREMALRKKAAIVLSSKLYEMLGTAETTQTCRHG